LNVARAGGISYGLEDSIVPKEEIDAFSDSGGFGLVYTASGFVSPIPGLSGGMTAGLNLVTFLFSPSPASSRTSIIAWMPEELAGDNPQLALGGMLEAASVKALKDHGYDAEPHNNDEGSISMLFMFDGQLCKRPDLTSWKCNMFYSIREPDDVDNSPLFLTKTHGPVKFFNPAATVRSYYKFKRHLQINELEYLVATSKYLPEWFSFYVPPKEVKLDATTKVKLPLIINQGKIHYFIKISDT
jgi:hypothetical protein